MPGADLGDYECVALAAGKGTRLGALAAQTHKCMIPVEGKPWLSHVLEAIGEAFDRCLVVVGHRAEEIESHFGSRLGGLQLGYHLQSPCDGTGGALLQVRERLAGTFTVVLADTYFRPEDIRAIGELDAPALSVIHGDTPDRQVPFVGGLVHTGMYLLRQADLGGVGRVQDDEIRIRPIYDGPGPFDHVIVPRYPHLGDHRGPDGIGHASRELLASVGDRTPAQVVRGARR